MPLTNRSEAMGELWLSLCDKDKDGQQPRWDDIPVAALSPELAVRSSKDRLDRGEGDGAFFPPAEEVREPSSSKS
jgi:hypothetical protein